MNGGCVNDRETKRSPSLLVDPRIGDGVGYLSTRRQQKRFMI
jgi:hypothetical protein